MADLANLVLAVDSTQVKTGVAALDGLTAAGARAEAATVGMGGGFRGAASEASAMAATAQLSARAAMDQAAGFRVATDAARVNTLALRETMVVTRELMRGNYTRLPGSLMLLGQGVGSQGGIGAYASALAQQLGLIKQVQNAELAEAAAAAASATAGVEAAARKAAGNIMAADTEVALAEAQLRVAEGAAAESAAQVRLAAAQQAVAASAAEATVAEDALATAMGRSTEAQTASAAASRTVIGAAGVGLLGIATVAGIAYGAIKEFQNEVKDSGVLDKYAESLNLTDAQVKKLGGSIAYLKDGTREISDLTVTFGDVMAGVWEQVTVNSQGAFGNMKTAAGSAFDDILSFWDKTSAALSAGLWTLGDIAKDVFHYIAQQIGDGFISGVNKAIDAINGLNAKIPKWAGGGDPNLIGHLKVDPNVSTGAGLGATIRRQADANYAAALAANHAAYGGVMAGALAHRRGTMKDVADGNRPKKGRKGRTKKAPKQPVDHANDQIARLDEEILSAKITLTKDATEEATLKAQQLQIARDKTIADAAQLLRQNKISGPEFEIIKLRAQELDVLKEKAVFDARDIKLLEQDQKAKDQLYGFQTDALKAANDNADSQAEHRKLQLQMLDITYEQKKYDLEILASKQRIANDLAGLALTEGQIAHLPTQYATDKAAVLQKTQDPLHAWLDSIHTEGPAITEALQAISVKGFDSLAQGIAGVVTGTESLGKVFKDISRSIISDIVQMTVKMLIFKAISSVFGSKADPLAPLPSANGNVFSGGSLMAFADGGIVGGPTLFSMSGGKTGLMGEAGPEAIMPLARDGSGRLGVRAANDTQRGPIELKISFGSAPDFAPYVEQVAGAAAGQAVKISVDHTNQTIKALRRPGISGGR